MMQYFTSKGGEFFLKMERQPKGLQLNFQEVLPIATPFSTRLRVTPDKIQALCGGCSLGGILDNQCGIHGLESQADYALAKRCDWKRP